jgi:hypothetical protein
MTEPPCQSPVPLESLVDYWSGASTTGDAERIEDHVFSCDSCSRRLSNVASLARGIVRVSGRRGGVHTGATESMVARFATDGLHMRHYRAQPGERIACTVGADDDLLITYLRADLSNVERVDMVLRSQGRLIERIEDAPVDATTGQVIYTLSGDVARTFPAMSIDVELISIDKNGERKLGTYRFEHTPFRAG